MEVLSVSDGRTVLLVRTYEQCRQEAGQKGYRCLKQDGTQLEVNPQIWKSFQTVLAFLQAEGFQITWREAAWIGYIKYVFQALAPSVPQPGQLKNKLLVKKFISNSGDFEAAEPVRTVEELSLLYQRVIRKELRDDLYVQALLGIRQI